MLMVRARSNALSSEISRQVMVAVTDDCQSKLFSLSMNLTSICLNDVLHSFKTMIESQRLEGFSVLKGEGELVYENPVIPPLEIDWI